LEPTISAYAARLTAHVERGEMIGCNVRYAALVLLSPLILLFLHQDELGGRDKHPTDIDEFIVHHAEAFVWSYATAPTGGSRPRKT
jgi:hypothetical protein